MKTYAITLEQLSALAEFISESDWQGRDSNVCSNAHHIVIAVMGEDARLIYKPLEELEEPA